MQNSHSRSGALVLIIRCFDYYFKSLICPSQLLCCWVYISLDPPMIYKFLIIICIIVSGIYSSLELSYLNSSEIILLSHRYIRPIYTYSFDFLGSTNMKSPKDNTSAGLLPDRGGTLPYKRYV